MTIWIILTFVLTLLTLGALLWAGAVWLQAAVYNEPAEDLYWRAPAAAGGVTLILVVWSVVAARSPGNYPGMFAFPMSESKEFHELVAVHEGKEARYQRDKSQRGGRFYDAEKKPLRTHPEAVIVEEDGAPVRFEPDRDEKKHFKIEKGRSLRYVDPAGREMYEDTLGRLTLPRYGLLVGNLFLNLLHLAVWFAVVWLLLRFTWGHALGLAVVLWLVTTFTALPLILNQVEAGAAGRDRAALAPGPVALPRDSSHNRGEGVVVAL